MTSNSKHDRRPTLACEIAADRVLAGRAADAGRMVEMASARELAPGIGGTRFDGSKSAGRHGHPAGD